ncbi:MULTISPECIES: glycosyltransferase [Aerococcus]|uniref:glycosyltransferase n=1 Tax=Aerococcus TaxID=1375 RepID=UPI000DCE7D4D|nr:MULTISPECIES: glycosyltransferase [Aerococcus]KAA9299879.1 glycosyltransferase family 4 protein [Aerococcus tenax]MDK6688084.1 glycosyltransferase [Aerococcus urinae]MDK8132549.1 glycosyltransferase [Aerococcus urinae]MDK8484102.1 glycosyltransferase [Aerococcus urinae]MDL5178236.1 glycosyltransferase [Aerococcus tenax]
MKIGFFTDTYFPQTSGVASSIQTLKEELTKAGHQVYIFTTTDPKVKEDQAEEGIFRYESIPFLFFKERRVAVTTLRPIYKKAKELDLDIIHTHTEFTMGIFGVMVAHRLRLPIVHTYHTWYENYLHYILNGHLVPKAAVKSYTRYFCQLANTVIAPSQMIRQVLQEYGVERPIEVIPSGVRFTKQLAKADRQQLKDELGLADDQLVLITVNRIAQEKNLDSLIQQMAKLLELIPQARLLIVGDGPEKDHLMSLSQELKISHAVIFTGMVPHEEINGYYQIADIYVNLSVTETQGITFIEAIGNHLPIVAMKNDYLLNLNRTASIGKLLDQVDQFSQAVLSLAGSASENCQAFKRLEQEISAQTFYERVYALYTSLIRKQESQMEDDDTSFFEKISENIWPFQ